MTGPDHNTGIADEAAAWAARLDRGDLTASEDAALAAWLAADVRHLGAYARAEAVLATFDRARALAAPAMPAPSVPAPAVPERSRRAFLAWGAAAAAGIAGTVFIPRERPPAATVRYASAVGALRRFTLADGSRLTLGTAAEVLVRLTDRERRVELVHGAALFDVAADARRPFSVALGGVIATAVGTSFSVEHAAADGGVVLVRHGVVAVAAKGSAQPQLARAGDRVSWAAADPAGLAVARVDPEALRRGLAWTEGMLAFDGQTMTEAVAQFSRYGGVRIMIADPTLAQRKVTGWFSATDPRGFAHAAAASLGAVAEDRADTVVIRPES